MFAFLSAIGEHLYNVQRSKGLNAHFFRYWDVVEGEPFPPPNTDESDPNNPLFYLKRALGWLDQLGMKGLIDLHAAPGLIFKFLAP